MRNFGKTSYFYTYMILIFDSKPLASFIHWKMKTNFPDMVILIFII